MSLGTNPTSVAEIAAVISSIMFNMVTSNRPPDLKVSRTVVRVGIDNENTCGQ